MPPFLFNQDATALINELSEPVPTPLRPKFVERVRRLLRDDEALFPAKIVEACQKAQIELMIAPAVDLEAPQPAKPQPARSPWRRRA